MAGEVAEVAEVAVAELEQALVQAEEVRAEAAQEAATVVRAEPDQVPEPDQTPELVAGQVVEWVPE